MKVNVTQELKDLQGDPMGMPSELQTKLNAVRDLLIQSKQQEAIRLLGELCVAPPAATVRRVCCDALVAAFDDERNLAGEEKVKRFLLAQKLMAAEEVDLTSEDVSLLKKLVAKGFGPLVVGQAWQLLDPASVGDQTTAESEAAAT